MDSHEQKKVKRNEWNPKFIAILHLFSTQPLSAFMQVCVRVCILEFIH